MVYILKYSHSRSRALYKALFCSLKSYSISQRLTFKPAEIQYVIYPCVVISQGVCFILIQNSFICLLDKSSWYMSPVENSFSGAKAFSTLSLMQIEQLGREKQDISDRAGKSVPLEENANEREGAGSWGVRWQHDPSCLLEWGLQRLWICIDGSSFHRPVTYECASSHA